MRRERPRVFDLGVAYFDSKRRAMPLTRVLARPQVGQYCFDGQRYEFARRDQGRTCVAIVVVDGVKTTGVFKIGPSRKWLTSAAIPRATTL